MTLALATIPVFFHHKKYRGFCVSRDFFGHFLGRKKVAERKMARNGHGQRDPLHWGGDEETTDMGISAELHGGLPCNSPLETADELIFCRTVFPAPEAKEMVLFNFFIKKIKQN